MRPLWRIGTGHDSALWPVLLLLLAVLVPTTGLVWLLRAAMENERLAVRQRLADVYNEQLEFARRRIDAAVNQKLAELDNIATQTSAAEAFSRMVAYGFADSVLVLDDSGKLAYPAPPFRTSELNTVAHPRWADAQRMEFADNDPRAAAVVYQRIAAETSDRQTAARAQQALARCMLRLGQRNEAIGALQQLRQQDGVVDAQGRSLAADAELRLLELLDESSAERPEVASSLVKRLNRYDQPLPAEQRRFLMRETSRLIPKPPLPTLAAEDLAGEILAGAGGQLENGLTSGRIQSSPVRGTWLVRTSSGRVIALYRTETLRSVLRDIIDQQPIPDDVTIAVHEPTPAAEADEFVSLSLSPALPGWRLALSLDSNAPFAATARERTAFFVWLSVAIVVITAALAILVASLLRRQMQLARLKNDLVATVSHELKTPLASIRLLVDTLLDADPTEEVPGRTREYLELIAMENARLSHLIDNFLTFSRMEGGKHRFDIQPADGALVVRQAVDAVAERYAAAGASLRVDAAPPLPIRGDSGALVTVIVNLLDNALKYTGETKRVAVTAQREGNRVRIAVEDNGIGLSPRAARRVFDRFYQVDQRLSRASGGCGLGLSIVKSIVEAHGGQVRVESRLGEGSKFIVTLPLDQVAPNRISMPPHQAESVTTEH